MIANIKPGILVSLRTRIVGGVEYAKTDLEADSPSAQGDVKRWETVRVVANVTEWERAKIDRAKAQALIRKACIKTDFGLLCPEANENTLDLAISQAKEIAASFNRCASDSRIEVYVLKGRIASSDEEAARGIASEVRGLLDSMDKGIAEADPIAIRAAAARARSLSQILDTDAARAVSDAVAQARDAARQITRRVIDAGESIETVVSEIKRERLDTARFACLDVSP